VARLLAMAIPTWKWQHADATRVLFAADFSAAALASWREYLGERFGPEWSAKCLNINNTKIADIPIQVSSTQVVQLCHEGMHSDTTRACQPLIAPDGAMTMTPQWAVWLRFRNREMAKSNEAFRHGLHTHSGGAVVAGNELQFAGACLHPGGDTAAGRNHSNSSMVIPPGPVV
jgi:hypothetical protein